MTDSMGPGKLVRHMQNPSYTYDEYLICIRLGPSISSVKCKNLSYSGPSYSSSPVPFWPCLHIHSLSVVIDLRRAMSYLGLDVVLKRRLSPLYNEVVCFQYRASTSHATFHTLTCTGKPTFVMTQTCISNDICNLYTSSKKAANSSCF